MGIDIDSFLTKLTEEKENSQETKIDPSLDLDSDEEEIEEDITKISNSPKSIEDTKKQIRESLNKINKSIEDKDFESISNEKRNIKKILKKIPGHLEVHFLEVKKEETLIEKSILELIVIEEKKIKKHLKKNFEDLVEKIKKKESKNVFEQLFQVRTYWNGIHPLIRSKLLQEEEILRRIEIEVYSFLINERNLYAKKKAQKVKHLEKKCRDSILKGNKEEAQKYYEELSREINKNHICSPQREEDLRKLDQNMHTIITHIEDTQAILSNLSPLLEEPVKQNIEQKQNSKSKTIDTTYKTKKKTIDEQINDLIEEFKKIETKERARKKYKNFKQFLRENKVEEYRQKELLRELAKEWRNKQ